MTVGVLGRIVCVPQFGVFDSLFRRPARSRAPAPARTAQRSGGGRSTGSKSAPFDVRLVGRHSGQEVGELARRTAQRAVVPMELEVPASLWASRALALPDCGVAVQGEDDDGLLAEVAHGCPAVPRASQAETRRSA